MSRPAFSIVVPVYNVEAYLVECIESILSQTCNNFEIILIDDGSGDSSGKICDEYALRDSRIKVVHQPNKGLSAARNRGIEEAGGEYVLFLDSDDLIRCDTLELLFSKTAAHPDVIVFGIEYFFTDGTTASSAVMPDIKNIHEYLCFVARNKAFEQCVACNKVYNKTLFQNQSYRFVNGILHEDGPFFHATIANAHSISVINQPLYRYRKGRADAITASSSFRNFDSLMKGVDWVLENALAIKEDLKYQKSILLHTVVFGIIQNYSSEQDVRRVVSASSALKMKRLLCKFLYSKFSFPISLLGLLAVISPGLSRWAVRLRQ